MERKKSFESWFTPGKGLSTFGDYVTISRNTICISAHLFGHAREGFLRAKIGFDINTGALYIEPTSIDDPHGYKLITRENKEGRLSVFLNVPSFIKSYDLLFNPHKRKAVMYDAHWDTFNEWIVVRDVQQNPTDRVSARPPEVSEPATVTM